MKNKKNKKPKSVEIREVELVEADAVAKMKSESVYGLAAASLMEGMNIALRNGDVAQLAGVAEGWTVLAAHLRQCEVEDSEVGKLGRVGFE